MSADSAPPTDPGAALAAGGEAYVDDRLDEARALWEHAFRGFVSLGQQRAAARVATLLGELHWGGLGNTSTGRGWLERARRLLDGEGPCRELGYWELARLACDRLDIAELHSSAVRALEIASETGDVALHTRALADSGFALVCLGRLEEGFAQLEEALATLTSGEIGDPFAVSTTCCALLSACDRAGDLARLAELYIRCGRLDEAAQVLTGSEDQPAAAAALGSLLMARGEPGAAKAVLDSAVPAVRGDVLRGSGLLLLLVEAAQAAGHHAAAQTALDRLRDLSAASAAPVVRGATAYAEAALAAADNPDAARTHYEAALADFTAANQPWQIARTHLALARLLLDSDPAGAKAAARSAHAVAVRCGWSQIRDEAAALLRGLGVIPPRSSGEVLPDLSARETEVLRGLRRGMSNAEIAADLFLSPKTVEHHVSRILAKLGARTRAEAAAITAAAETA